MKVIRKSSPLNAVARCAPQGRACRFAKMGGGNGNGGPREEEGATLDFGEAGASRWGGAASSGRRREDAAVASDPREERARAMIWEAGFPKGSRRSQGGGGDRRIPSRPSAGFCSGTLQGGGGEGAASTAKPREEEGPRIGAIQAGRRKPASLTANPREEGGRVWGATQAGRRSPHR